MKSGNKEAVKGELDNQLKAYKDFKEAKHTAEAVQECSNKTAELVTETGMAWHLRPWARKGSAAPVTRRR
jgi:hypothetical protein